MEYPRAVLQHFVKEVRSSICTGEKDAFHGALM